MSEVWRARKADARRYDDDDGVASGTSSGLMTFAARALIDAHGRTARTLCANFTPFGFGWQFLPSLKLIIPPCSLPNIVSLSQQRSSVLINWKHLATRIPSYCQYLWMPYTIYAFTRSRAALTSSENSLAHSHGWSRKHQSAFLRLAQFSAYAITRHKHNWTGLAGISAHQGQSRETRRPERRRRLSERVVKRNLSKNNWPLSGRTLILACELWQWLWLGVRVSCLAARIHAQQQHRTFVRVCRPLWCVVMWWWGFVFAHAAAGVWCV